MSKISAKERKEALRKRQEDNIRDKDKGGLYGKGVLDTSKFEDVEFWQPKKGTNTIDIVPYLVSSPNHPQGLEEGFEDYILDVWVHRSVGPKEDSFVCLKNTFGKPCPICEEAAAMRKKSDSDDDEIKALSPSRRVFYNVIDLANEDEGIKIFGVSHFLFEKEMLEEVTEAEQSGDGRITFADLEDGRSIKFRATPEKWGKNEYFKFKSFSFLNRDPYGDDVLEDSYPLDAMMIVPTYDEVQRAFFGMDEESDSGQEEEKKIEKEESPRYRRKGRKQVKEESEEDPVEDKKEEKPRRERGRVQKSKCPHGHVFGTDCDGHDECSECDVWESCADEQDRLKALETDEVPF